MKKILGLLFFSLALIACKKYYPENPRTLSNKPTEELKGVWRVVEFTIDGIDSTSAMLFPVEQEYNFYYDPYQHNIDVRAEKDSLYLTGDLSVNNKKEGKLGVFIDSFIRKNDTLSIPQPTRGPFLNNIGSWSAWEIRKLYKGELKCVIEFKGKSYYLFMKKIE